MKLPEDSGYTNLNTATFDAKGTHWFTGQSGIYGRLDPASGEPKTFDAPKGRRPFGINATPDGSVCYASLAGSFIGRINADGSTTVLEERGQPQPLRTGDAEVVDVAGAGQRAARLCGVRRSGRQGVGVGVERVAGLPLIEPLAERAADTWPQG